VSVVIWGAGAIGGVLGAWLARAGRDVLLVDRDRDHVNAIRADGLLITGTRGEMRVRTPAALPDEVTGTLDLVILAVKCQDTGQAMDRIAPLLATDGVVVSAQNGLNEEVIAARVGADRTIGCFVHFSADWLGPGRVEHGGEHPIVVGELDGRRTQRVERIARLFEDFCETAVSDNIWGHLWAKLCCASLLFATALVDAPIAETLRRPGVGPVVHALVREALEVPDALGVRLEDLHGFRPDDYRTGDWRPPIEAMARFYEGQIKVRTGVWRDLAVRRRPTEVDCQIGVLVERGAALGLGMPLNRRLVALIHEVERGTPMGWELVERLSGKVERAGP
jgi:2-dehydropantoate 2-reductase